MKMKYGVLLLIVIAGVSFFSSLTGYVFGVRASKGKKTQTEIPVKTVASEEKEIRVKEVNEKVEQEVVHTYLVKEKDGNVTVFVKDADNTEKIYKEYDIPVTLLPQSDREMLKNGIEYKTLSEALQLIEDYS